MTISLILNSTACHNTWNTTTGTDQHRDKSFFRKDQNLRKDTVKDKMQHEPCIRSAPEMESMKNSTNICGTKTEYGTDTTDNTIIDQTN